MDLSTDDQWLNAKTAANYLGLRPATIYRLVNEGRLEARRSPLSVRIQDLHACLERCRVRPGTLAHLDPNAAKRAPADRVPPLTRAGTPDRRYGRRYPSPGADRSR